MDETEKRIRRKLRDDFVHYASKCLKIRTKSKGIQPFILNKVQIHINNIVEQQRRETGKVRAIILKGRQEGCSTYVEGRFYWITTQHIGMRAFILTHDISATDNLFEMVKRYHEYCPGIMQPTIEKSNAKELIFSKLDSGYKLGTAGNKAVGRSSTIQLLHGCLSEGTEIVNPIYGKLIKIQDHKIGDKVLTHTGKIAKIRYISFQEKECMSIKLKTLSKFPLIATKEHKFYTKNGWKELKDLNIGDEIGYPVSEITNEGNCFILPEAPKRPQGGGRQFICSDYVMITYKLGLILGLYLADGYIKKQSKFDTYSCVQFIIHNKEVKRTIEWLEPFKEYFSSIKIIHRKGTLTSVITAYGNRFATLINNICGRTVTKHFPIAWKDSSKRFCKGLLHGYISGDGSSYDDDRRIRVSSIYSALTITARDIAASLGYGWASIEKLEAGVRHNRNEKERYTFSLYGKGANKLAIEIDKPTPKILRKSKSSTKIFNGYAWLKIKSIENVGIKKVYDFEIDHEDHSYCTIHGATHNSEVAYWPNASEHAKGILQAVPNSEGTEIFIESTANGQGNYFHEQWQLAERGLSDFIPIFIPWFWDDDYVKEVPIDFVPSDEEEELIAYYNLSPSQIMWRRHKIMDFSSRGVDGTKSFYQEYPCNSAEAFQLSGEDSFILPETVMLARKTKIEEEHGNLVIGVDPARFGDDRTSIIRRRGRRAYGLESYVKKNTMEVVGIVNSIIIREHPQRVFVDIGGLGAGVFDRLGELGHKDIIVPVNGGETPLDQKKYYNKRAEMWGLMKEWLLSVPCELPDSDTLHADLCGTRYTIDSNSRLVLEKKDLMKKRGLRSPDEADALALTFALPEIALINARKKEHRETAQSLAISRNNLDKLKKGAYTR